MPSVTACLNCQRQINGFVQTMLATPQQLHIGTSGWNYRDWKGVFYPSDLKQREWLGYYAEHFGTVEINNTFYHLPRKEVFETWRSTVPENFVFVVKASRYITHMKKLADPQQSVRNFLENVRGLDKKLGALLFQLPPFWNLNIDRLDSFLEYLTHQQIIPQPKIAIELRNATWAQKSVYALLQKYNVTLCFVDWPNLTITKPETAPIIYIRRHGAKELYASGYSDRQIQADADRIKMWLKNGCEVFVYFNNDLGGHAIHDAKELIRKILG